MTKSLLLQWTRCVGFSIVALWAFDVSAAAPSWWTAPTTSIVESGAPSNNYAPANLGQLKHVATQARKHLDATLPGGAGSTVSALVDGFADDPATNFAPINLGQLKAVAKPFYDRLIAAGYDTKANLIARGYPATWSHAYPWDPATPKTTNYAPANLGQLKMVFSFNATGSPGDELDSDGDGLSDWNEVNIHGTDPLKWSTMDDDISDGWKVLYGLNPLDPTLASQLAPSGSGLTIYQTFIQGRNPHAASVADPGGAVDISLYTSLE